MTLRTGLAFSVSYQSRRGAPGSGAVAALSFLSGDEGEAIRPLRTLLVSTVA